MRMEQSKQRAALQNANNYLRFGFIHASVREMDEIRHGKSEVSGGTREKEFVQKFVNEVIISD